MRRLGTEALAEKKRKRNMLILSIFMLAILVAGTAAYGFIASPHSGTDSATVNAPSEGEIQYNGNRWFVTHLGRQFSFAFSPESETVNEIPVETTIELKDYLGKNVYLDAENGAILQEIGSSLSGFAGKVSEGCFGACERDLPEKTCEDYIIVWTDSSEKKVYQDQNCVFIEGDLEAVDAFLFKMLGIQQSL